ncbi:heme ABC exporter ATP-binding protein CcmA [Enterovirga rhinocerotis]|uniref:Heme exporter protein A n=1 Tax=Enterovirga rhinocerotis TaxID=1339210 RepID=A0A4R7BQB3_9HYPH|nr:heme ABC exporter ATP-binding protein CcmA [Enterovirga rhinocerotis]TDR87353.1 heme exporter protein A [Enterovirga rhinocerotis]
MTRLTVSDLACRRAGRLVLRGVGFSLEAGDALVVTGRNGAGKSTLLALLAGVLRPDAGTIAFEAPGEATLPESVHWLAAKDGLKAQLTARENLLFASACLGGGLSADAALARVGLAAGADLPTAYLSSGQRRRLTLARLLASRRPVWLLDEPTNALDSQGQALLADLLREHRADGGIVVAATHLPLALPEARELALGPAATAERDA